MNQTFKRAMSLFMALTMVFSMVPSFGTHAHAEELETEPVIVTEAPAAEAPVVEAPETEAPETEAPTQAPETEAPATEAPVVETEAPVVTEETKAVETEAAEETEAVEETEEVTPDETEEIEFIEEVVEYAMAATAVEGSAVADLGISYETTVKLPASNATQTEKCIDEWTASGDTVKGELVGAKATKGSNRYYYCETTSELTMTNNTGKEAELSFVYGCTIAYGCVTVNDTTHSSSAEKQKISVILPVDGTFVIELFAKQRQASNEYPAANGASISITNLKLTPQGSAEITFAEPEFGSYTVVDTAGNVCAVPGTVSAKTTERFTMTATPNEGYVFAGWYNETSGIYLSADATYTTLFGDDCTVTAKFMPAEDGVYGVGDTMFTNLTDAATAAAASSVKTVVLLKNAELEGSHTIPADVTLLIPFDANHVLSEEDPESVNGTYTEKPGAFRTLTMKSGSSITVNGAICVNAQHLPCSGGSIYGGTVFGQYGEICMASGSSVVLNKGANLYAWGYVWGDGTVEAKSGATIYEKMQVTDYRGGSNTAAIALRNTDGLTDGAFPFNQYYIQNVEVKEILHEGASLMAHAAVFLSGESPAEAAVEFIGSSNAMFSASGATITKEYKPAADRLVLSINGDENSMAELNGLYLAMSGMEIQSSNFILPINANIDININAGYACVNQALVLQPGVRVYIASGATLATNENIYVMDIDQWGDFVFHNNEGGTRQRPVAYAPSLNGGSNRIIASDAVIDINGKVELIGGIFTTEGGAQIISSEKSGGIEFWEDAPEDSLLYQLVKGSDLYEIPVTAAKLTNGDSAKPFTETKGAVMDDVYNYCKVCDAWHEGEACEAPTHVEITWVVNGEGEPQEVDYNTTPVYGLGDDPTKASDATYHYTFAGWATSADGTVLSSLPAATADATYFAIFTAEEHTGKDDGDCTTAVICSCGYTITAANAAHTFTDEQSKTAATCMATGSVTWKCANCDQTKTETLDKDSDNHTKQNTTVKDDKAATCTEAGYTGDTYCECGVKIETGTATSALGHTFGDTTAAVAATCQAGGNVEYKQCAVCSLYFAADAATNSTEGKADATSFAISQKEHSYTGAIKNDGDSKDATHSYLCVNGCNRYGGAVAHTWNDGEVTTAPGCESEGEMTYTCTAAGCGATYTEPVEAKGHKDESNDHTCDNGCGIYQGEHADGEDDKDHLCDYCNGEVEDETCYDYDEDHDCDECGAATSVCVDEDIKDHYCDYGGCENYMGTHADSAGDGDHICDYCNTGEGLNDCSGGTAYCNASAKCEECGEEYGDRDPNNHASDEFEYYCDNYDGTHNKNRTCCGEEITNEPHTYNPKTHVCLCGAVEHFTLTVQYMAEEYGFGVWKEVELTVAYGSKLNEHPDISIPDGVYTTGFDTSEFKGDFTLSYYAIGPDADHLENAGNKLEEVTMPAYNAVLRGVYLFTGWHNVGEGWTYEINDVTQKTGWTALERDVGDYYWYYLDPETGIRAEGIVRVPYPTETIRGKTYGPNAEDLKYAEDNNIAFIDKEEAWFIFAKDTEDGIEDGMFRFDETGFVNDGKSYALNGQIAWHPGAVEIDGDYYYFLGDEVNGGNIMTTGDVYVARVAGEYEQSFVIGGVYTFGEDGILCNYNGITNVDGKLRYYKDAQLMLGLGLTEVDGKFIYVRSNGELVVNGQYWVGQNDLDIATGMYSFDENGYMINPIDATKNGVIDGYYYVNGKPYYAGLIEYNDSYIYVASSGKLATGKYYVTKVNDTGYEPGFYFFDEEGYMEQNRNGIVSVNGVLYYYVDNEIQYGAGLVKLEDGYIYVKSNGQLATGLYWITNTNGLLTAAKYEFGDDGYMVTDVTLDGVVGLSYYIDGVKQYGLGLIQLEDGRMIYVKTNGELATGKYWPTNHNGLLDEVVMCDFSTDGYMIVTE